MYSQNEPIRILLVNIVDTAKIVKTYPVGLNSLKAFMQNNYAGQSSVEIRDTQIDDVSCILAFAHEWRPHILGLSIAAENKKALDHFLLHISALTHSRNFPILVFGRHVATFGYQHLLSAYPQAVCVRGEGELALAGLCSFLKDKVSLHDVDNVAFIDSKSGCFVETGRKVITDLSSIGPIHHVDLPRYADGNVWMEASRGCPWGMCRFCSISEFWGPASYRREKPVATLLNEIRQFEQAGIKRFTFTDEEFVGLGIPGVERAHAIAQSILESHIDIAFHADIRAASIWNKNDTPRERKLRLAMVRTLKAAGLKTVFIGIESGSPSQLNRYNKGSDIHTAEKAIEICRRMRINMALGFIMIEPLSSKEEIIENIAFIRRNNLLPCISVPINVLRLYPGQPYLRALEIEEEKSGRCLYSPVLDLNRLTYEVSDYMHPAVAIIAELSQIYMESQYDLFNSIRWFERFNPSVFGTAANRRYNYLKHASEQSKQIQLDFLYALASLSDSQLMKRTRPEQVLSKALRKRDEFVSALKRQIEERRHLSECEVIYEQIKKYLANRGAVFRRN